MANPKVTPLVERRHDGGFIVSVANGHRSFTQGTLAAGVNGFAGMVLGLILAGTTATSAPLATNTGNGVFGAVTLNTVATQVGAYSLSYTAPTAFTVTAPDGATATGTNGVAFSALGIGFTMTTGGTPMAVGDGFTITVTGKVGNPTAVSAANAGNVGNSTSSAVTTTGYAPTVGDYKVVFVQANTNAGAFEVEDPSGRIIGTGNVAAAFKAGGISFTIADGATDFIPGDAFVVSVAAAAGQYKPWDPANVDGSQTVAGILYADKNATNAAQPCAVMDLSCEVNLSELIWPTGMNAASQAIGVAGLRSLGIKAR